MIHVLVVKLKDHNSTQTNHLAHALMDNMIMEMEVQTATTVTINVQNVPIQLKTVSVVPLIETMTHQIVLVKMELI